MGLGTAGIGAFWAITSNKYEEAKYLKTEKDRVENYEAYAVKMMSTIKDKMQYNAGVLERKYPSAEEAAELGIRALPGLWSKSSVHDDFLDVRLGKGDIPSFNEIEIPKEQLMQEHDPLNNKISEIKLAMSMLKDVPVSISL